MTRRRDCAAKGFVLSPEGARLDSPGQRPGEAAGSLWLQAPTGRCSPAPWPRRGALTGLRQPGELHLPGLRPGLSSRAPSGLRPMRWGLRPKHRAARAFPRARELLMAITDLAAPPSSPADMSADNYLTHGRGVKSWLFTLDHKRIGVMYLVSILASFAAGRSACAAGPHRADHARPDDRWPATRYNQLFTLHGAVMIFLFLIPGIPATWAISCCRSCWGPRTWPSRG